MFINFILFDYILDFDSEFIKNIILVITPTLIGILGSKLLINSWQIRKEKFALRKEILVNFQETWPASASLIYGLYLKIAQEYSEIVPNAEYKGGEISVTWTYPVEESEKPFNKFSKDFQKLNEELIQIAHKVNGFKGLLVLYYGTSKKIIELFDGMTTDMHGYHLRINRMVAAKNFDEFVKSNDEILEMKPQIRKKIHDLEKILIATKLENPKT